MWVVHWGLLLRLRWRTGVCPWGPGVEVVQLLGHRGSAAPGPQGRWQRGQQELQRSRKVWQPVLARTPQYSCLENPWQRSLAGHGPQDHEELGTAEATRRARMQGFFCPRQRCPAGAEPEGGAAAGVAGPWRRQERGDGDCLHGRSQAAPSLLSGLLSRAQRPAWRVFLVAPPTQARRGRPRLGSFCCSARQACRGAPPAGVLLCGWGIRPFQGHPSGPHSVVQCSGVWRASLSLVQLLVLAVGERGYGDGSTPQTDSAVSPCSRGCLALLHRRFPPQSPPSHPLDSSLHRQQLHSPLNSSF